MGLHPEFPKSPYAELLPETRWFPAAEELRAKAYERLLPPLVARIRDEVHEWRNAGYPDASATSRALIRWWFDQDHPQETGDGTLSNFRYYFAQREAVETVIWLHDVKKARDKFDLLRFDASGAISHSMFDEQWPRYVLKMATGAGKTKVLSLLIAWSYFHKTYEPDSTLSRNFLLIAPNIIVLDRLRADFDGLNIFFGDPILPDNGFEGRNWRDDFQVTLHIQDEVRAHPPTGNIFLTLTGEQKEQALAQKEREFRELILRAYKAEPLADSGLSFFHGKKSGRLVIVGPINLPLGRLFVEEVILECRKRNLTRVDVLAFEFEMGLFPAVLDEAKGKGIDLQPKYIPAEVFDKRAVEKGQVVFHDVSFVEAVPRHDKKRKLEVKIELLDFSVFYTQGIAEAAIEGLRDGKSEVICDQGQLVKISKDKKGVVTREILTKSWTDWVDYWAVDFDYEKRKEIIKVPVGTGLGGVATLPGFEHAQGEIVLQQFEERWTGAYIFENEWQSFRTRQDRELELKTAEHSYELPGRYTVAVKVIDIFGNDTMTLVPVNVG